jgi:hypothetical protein
VIVLEGHGPIRGKPVFETGLEEPRLSIAKPFDISGGVDATVNPRATAGWARYSAQLRRTRAQRRLVPQHWKPVRLESGQSSFLIRQLNYAACRHVKKIKGQLKDRSQCNNSNPTAGRFEALHISGNSPDGDRIDLFRPCRRERDSRVLPCVAWIALA